MNDRGSQWLVAPGSAAHIDDPRPVPSVIDAAEVLVERFDRARLFLEQGRAAEVVDELRRVLQSLTVMQATAFGILGSAFDRLGSEEERDAAFHRAVEMFQEVDAAPGPVEAVSIASALIGVDRRSDALELLMAVSRDHPDAVGVHALLARELEAAGRSGEAARLHHELGMRPERVDGRTEHLRRAVALEPGNPTYRIDLARMLLEAGDHGEATALLDAVAADHPESEIVAFLRAEAIRRRGDARQAISAADALLRANPELDGALLVRARARADVGDVEGALEDFGAVIERQPDDPMARFLRALLLWQTGRAPEAVADARHLAHIDDSAVSHGLLGRILFHADRMEDALAALDRALALGLVDREIRRYRAETAAHLGRWQEAKEMLDRLIEEAPDDAAAVESRGRVLAAMGDPAAAVADFDRVLDFHPQPAVILHLKAMALSDLNDVSAMLETTTRLLRMAPDEDFAMNVHGMALVRNGMWEEGLEVLAPVVARYPEDGAAQFFKAWALHELEQPEAALVAIEAAAAATTPALEAPAGRLRAQILSSLGRFEEADARATELIESGLPDDGSTHLLRGQIRVALRRLQQAEVDLHRALELSSRTDDDIVPLKAWAWLGEAARVQGDFSAALDALDRALAIDPDSAFVHGTRGQVFLALGLRDEAERAFRAALDADPALPWACVGLADLLREDGRLDEALAITEAGLAADSTSGEVRGTRAQVLRAFGRLDEAIDDLRLAWVQEPVAWIAHELAEALLSAGGRENAEEALRVADTALELPAASGLLLRSRADALRMMNRPVEALSVLDQYVAETDDDEVAEAIRAHLLLDLGRTDEALDAAERVLGDFPDYAFARYAKVRALSNKRLKSTALAEIETLLELAPDDGWARITRTALLCELRRVEDAVAEAGPLLAHNPDDALVLAMAGAAERHLIPPRLDDAIAHLARAAELDPDVLWYTSELGEVLHAAGRTAEAEVKWGWVVERVLSGDLSDADSESAAGWAAIRLGRPDEAIRLLQDALSVDSDLVTWFNLGLALLQSGRGELGLDEYEAAAESAVGHADRAWVEVVLRDAELDLKDLIVAGLPPSAAGEAQEAEAVLADAIGRVRSSPEEAQRR